MDFTQLSLLTAGLVIVMMTGLWLLSLALKNSSIVDIFWGAGFVMITLVGLYVSQHSARQIAATAMVTIWGGRLFTHILLRNAGKPEDFRYAQWRREHGPKWWRVSFFKACMLQGVLLWIIAVPLIVVQATDNPGPWSFFDSLGGIVWAIGFFFEAVWDYQLARFKADPENRGRVMTGGLWHFTRHPDYFGDAVQWWGFFLFAVGSTGWWTVFSPMLMTGLLLRVSGVTLLEQTLKTRPRYEEYMRNTSPFIPWCPGQ